ncbi:peptide chain release factor N(5)-glutamine methyltransferase [Gynuella sp.]|uniref:peptide chain release factor N(5)-glutamine methyltransferase n=1 Tax=Gynuella sp. TaxID=2969146 RepID=UPI003D110179
MKTIEQALTWAVAELADLEIDIVNRTDTPLLDAQILLAHVLGESRTYLLAFSEVEVSVSNMAEFESLIRQRRQGHPVAYLLGEKEFWSLPFYTGASTLIPRADTERLVEVTLETLPETASLNVADLGAGTGAVAIALATERPCWKLFAVEKSPDALALAEKNIARHQVVNVKPVLSDWLSAFEDLSLDVLVSNPPYIDEMDPHLSQGDVRFEPRTALVADDHGLADFKAIIQQAQRVLKPGGWVFFEHGFEQAKDLSRLLLSAGYRDIECFNDYAHHPRVTRARWQVMDA